MSVHGLYLMCEGQESITSRSIGNIYNFHEANIGHFSIHNCCLCVGQGGAVGTELVMQVP